ncbi:hypothetical protein K435DRAFT_643782 [Dendrothele bispora CBS 962.96]|uniref:THUMP domain-containing protein n=1 Tax=Dendrothele bispora (strain CBS 962.96) TaxID=1314807 RepID=A0A4S8MWY3_DENBC|nr:hypothetical protein K435DRAFT_643782 [Dendrothele bispora CBS 962.96]
MAGNKRMVDGPGVWVSCVKGKEKQTVGELYDLFDSIASNIWPIQTNQDEDGSVGSDSSRDEENGDIPLEAQIANEISVMKKPRAQQRFSNCQTNTPCVVFIACKPPVDPVRLVEAYINNVQRTGVTRTRYTHRFVPVSDTCYASIPDIESLCRTLFLKYFTEDSETKYTYKIELRMRNHTTLARPNIIQAIARCMPEGHSVDLTNPKLFILVEVFKSVCGISITKDYYTLHKYNVMEIATAKAGSELDDSGRVP